MHYWNLAALPQCSEIFMHTCQNKEVFSLFPVGWEFCFIFYMNSVEYSYMFFCIWKKDNPIPSSSPSCPYENNIGWFSNVSLLVHFWNKITLVWRYILYVFCWTYWTKIFFKFSAFMSMGKVGLQHPYGILGSRLH